MPSRLSRKVTLLFLTVIFSVILAGCSARNSIIAPDSPTPSKPVGYSLPLPTPAPLSETMLVTPAPRAAIPDPGKGGSLSVFIPGQIPTILHPLPSTSDATTSWASVNVYLAGPTFANFDWNSFRWELAGARDITVDSTGRVYSVTLRPDLKWSDGSAITGEDYQYAYENASLKNPNSPYLYQNQEELSHIKNFVVDSTGLKLEITLDNGYARNLGLSLISFPPIPKKVWGGKSFYDSFNNPEIIKPTVGGGPYLVENWNPPSSGNLKVNPFWYGGKANFDKINFKTGLPQAGLDALRIGQVDYSPLPLTVYEDTKSNPYIKIVDWLPNQADFRYLEFNGSKAPWNDKTLRKAIAYIINRDTINKLTNPGPGTSQFSFIAPSNPFYNPDVEKYDYDIDKARQILGDGGYKLENGVLKDKEGKAIKGTVSFSTTILEMKQIASNLQSAMKQIGIELTLFSEENSSLRQSITTKSHDLYLGRYTGNTDPDFDKNLFSTTGLVNTSGYSNPQVDDLFAKGAVEQDLTRRKTIYQEIQKIISEEIPILPLNIPFHYVGLNKKLNGVSVIKSALAPNVNQSFVDWYLSN